MSDETNPSDPLGIDKFGANATLRGQGYEPMPDPVQIQERAAEDARVQEHVDRMAALEEAGKELPPPVQYNERAPDGSRSDKKLDDKYSLTPARAARDLADWRRSVDAINTGLKEAAFAEQVDALRSPLAGEFGKVVAGQDPITPEAWDAMTPGQQDAYQGVMARQAELDRGQEKADLERQQAARGQQPEAQSSQEAYHELSALFQKHPQLIQEFEKQRQSDWQGAHQAVQAAEKWILDSAAQATAGVFVAFPELQGLSQQQLPIALNMMQKQNPQRFAQAMQHINGIQGMLEQQRHVQAQQQQRAAQQYQAQWSQWSAEEDGKFIGRFPEFADPVKASQIAARAQSYLENTGLSKDDIGRIWSGQASISLRDHRAQSILYDAMRYREAMAAVPQAAAKARTVPKVQRPGSPAERVPDTGAREIAAMNRLSGLTGQQALRSAAALLTERRGARR